MDITALRDVEYLGNDGDPDAMYEQRHFYAWVNSDFEARADGRLTGYYSAADALHFRAGSYSTYNQWRDQLARLAHGVGAEHIWSHPDEFAEKPFFELINFADNEGIIGPHSAARLLEAFKAYDARASEQDEFFYGPYCAWLEVFEFAAQDGLVAFH